MTTPDDDRDFDTPASPEDDDDEDFAALFERSARKPEVYEPGQRIQGTVVEVGREAAFVDVGGKGEATIELEELADDEGNVDVRPGDVIDAIVVSVDGGLKLSRRLARRVANREQLVEAHHTGQPVEGKVTGVIKGGYEVRIAGQRGFCPFSQIDTAFTEDPSIHVGQTYSFSITEIRDRGDGLVVSRRSLLEAEAREQEAEVRRLAVPGAVLDGRVVTVRPFGAFVDLGGGVQGLLHVSQMGHGRISDPSTVVKPGDAITVQVLAVDAEKGKLSLGLKQLLADPWTGAEDTYEVGQMLRGTVTRVADFGAFIELEPGIEALAHVSTFPPRGKRDAWREQVRPGAAVAVEILSFDSDRKRIGVAVVDPESVKDRDTRREAIREGERVVGQVERHEDYGVFVFLAPGRTGLMPASETGLDRGADLRKAFPVGSAVEVLVLEVDPATGRIRLSRRALLEAEERKDASDWAARQSGEGGERLGTLAEKLRAAMGPKKTATEKE